MTLITNGNNFVSSTKTLEGQHIEKAREQDKKQNETKQNKKPTSRYFIHIPIEEIRCAFPFYSIELQKFN